MKLKTDGEGRIFWDQAPSLEVPVVLHHPGFLPKTVTIPADGVEATIFLNFRLIRGPSGHWPGSGWETEL